MPKSSRELEVKLTLSDEQLRRARVVGLPGDFTSAPTQVRTLHAIYFDSPDLRLRSRGLSLRLRKSDAAWMQTVKAETGVIGGLSTPIECEVPVDGPQPSIGAIPDKELRKALRRAIGKSSLQSVFETEVERTTKQLTSAAGDHIEVALDAGIVRTTQRSEPIRELELELKAGDPATLVRIASTLIDAGPIHVSRWSKAERGYRLSTDQAAPEPAPDPGVKTRIEPEQTCIAAFEACCRAATAQVLHNWPVVLDSDDSEGPHQMRVGIRRLRTALRMFRPVIDSEALRVLDRKLKLLARSAGEVRDTDVLAHEIVGPLVRFADGEPGLRQLREMLSGVATRRRVELRSLLAGRDQTLLQIELAVLAESIARQHGKSAQKRLSRPVDSFAPNFLEESWRKLSKHGADLDGLAIEERHDMRKDLKRLRYRIHFLAPLFSAAQVRPYLKATSHMQDLFGSLNDIALAHSLRRIALVEGASGPDLSRAIGFAIGWHECQAELAWRDAKASWSALRRRRRFWK